ncbi:MAG: DUF5106 domain-containing protein [Chitinophagales bacterium]|nr:DUF5106 domain-containing protein [Chitinophagales bacterium]
MRYLKSLIVLILIFSIFKTTHAEIRKFDIQLSVKGAENQQAILAYNYGEKKFIADTIQFDDKGKSQIKGDKTYDDGTYLIVFPGLDMRAFDLIIRETAFQMATDTSDVEGHMKITGSVENQIMYEDRVITNQTREKAEQLNKIILDTNTKKQEKEDAQKKLDELTKQYIKDREVAISKHPEALHNKILMASRNVEMPYDNNEKDPEKRKENYNYFIRHYWDNTDFSDEALIKSPVVLPRIFGFLDMIYQDPDSISHAIDIILEKASVNPESYKIILSEMTDKFAKSKVMGFESIYVHLVDNYFAKGKGDWVGDDMKKKMIEQADKLRPTLIGQQAPNMNLYSLDNHLVNFYEKIKPFDYTILVFWNSECSHCQKEIPELHKIWKDSLQSQYNVGVVGISTEVELDHIQQFVNDNQLNNDFINAYDPSGISNFRNLYDINSTPVIILLNQKREIIAKKIAVKDLTYMVSTYDEQIQKTSSKKK